MIPKIIWQTYKTPVPPAQSAELIKSWLDLNPDYTWYYFDDEKCQKFIQDHFDDSFYQMYISLPIGVMKSDVWRIAVVYIYGGIYADLDTKCLVSANSWITDSEDLVVGVETPHGALNNFVFAAASRHPALKTVLETLMDLYNSPYFLDKNSPTPVQDFGANAWSYGILKHYGLENSDSMSKGGEFYNLNEQVKNEKTKFFPYNSHAMTPIPTNKSYVWHQTASVSWSSGYASWRQEQNNKIWNS